jgi:hypothetical protein
MLPKDSTHDQIKSIMLELMVVLYENGIREIHMGAMMRLLGVHDAIAADHDHAIMELDENFATMIAEITKNNKSATVPAGATLH